MSRRTLSQRRAAGAFTLVELLIVIAIIAILALIAVPNFLEAQIRAKVSRVKADLRTLATGIEAYSVDANHPPYDGEHGPNHIGWVTSQGRMTTPIAYLSSIPADVFQDPAIGDIPGFGTFFLDAANHRNHAYDYATAYWEGIDGSDAGHTDEWKRCFGTSLWKLTSCGPDKDFDDNGIGSFYGFRATYDPTNGTISRGDIRRSQAVAM